jgi:hypothetical protein
VNTSRSEPDNYFRSFSSTWKRKHKWVVYNSWTNKVIDSKNIIHALMIWSFVLVAEFRLIKSRQVSFSQYTLHRSFSRHANASTLYSLTSSRVVGGYNGSVVLLQCHASRVPGLQTVSGLQIDGKNRHNQCTFTQRMQYFDQVLWSGYNNLSDLNLLTN